MAFFLGAAIPALWFAARLALPGFQKWWLISSPNWLEGSIIFVWPSYLILFSDPDSVSVFVPIASILLNASLYACVAWMALILLRRHREARAKID